MGTAKRFLADETFESFDTQGKLPACEGSLSAQTTRTQAFQVLPHEVFRSVDDSQILGPAALDGGLSVSTPTLADKVERLHHHAFTAGRSQRLPPLRRLIAAGCVVYVHNLERRGQKQ